jgi:hypothetical protein
MTISKRMRVTAKTLRQLRQGNPHETIAGH